MKIKSVYFCEEMTYQTVSEFFKSIGEFADGDILNIYFDSPGGIVFGERSINDYVSFLHHDCGVQVNLHAIGDISSSVFNLFLNAKCNKIIHKSAYATLHLITYRINSDDRNRNFGDSIVNASQCEDFNSKFVKFVEKMHFTQDEINRIKNNEDVTIGSERIHEILKDINDIKLKNNHKIGYYIAYKSDYPILEEVECLA